MLDGGEFLAEAGIVSQRQQRFWIGCRPLQATEYETCVWKAVWYETSNRRSGPSRLASS